MNNYPQFLPQFMQQNKNFDFNRIESQINMLSGEIKRIEKRIIDIERVIINYNNNKSITNSIDSDNYTYINNNYSTDNYIL